MTKEALKPKPEVKKIKPKRAPKQSKKRSTIQKTDEMFALWASKSTTRGFVMTQDEIIEMAKQADELSAARVDWDFEWVEIFAKLVAAKEREAAEERVVELFTDMETPYLPDIVKAIRVRGEA